MKIKYQTEIDGLRAVSILLVIFHHLEIPYFKGGFIGVDIFFVISGYLISSIITKEINTNQFKITDFYKRRIIRLLPAYTLAIILSLALGFMLMLPAELVGFLNSVIYSSLFISNFYLWDQVGGYFAVDSSLVPLLHLWSLAVEEQFYLFWPLLVSFVLFITKKPLFLLLLLAILFACLSEWGATNYPAASYYLAPTRAFEFLMGAILVFIPDNKLTKEYSGFLSTVGVALLVFCLASLDKRASFPGMNAFWVCLGSCLLILCAAETRVGSVLNFGVMRFLGKISYPAYLYHWPLISYLHIVQVEFTPLVMIAILSLVLFLSTTTFLFVERPLGKFRQSSFLLVLLFGFVLPTTLLIGVSMLGISKEGWPTRFSDDLVNKSQAVLSKSHILRGDCNQGYVTSPRSAKECILGLANADTSVLLVGDSHANHFTGFIDVLSSDAGKRAYDLTQSSTPFLPELTSFERKGNDYKEYKVFKKRNDFIVKHLGTTKYDFVVLGGAFAHSLHHGVWDREISEEGSQLLFKNSFRQAISLIVDSGAVPVILEGNPQFRENKSRCTLNNLRFGLNKECHMRRVDHDDYFYDWQQTLSSFEEEFSSLIVIRTTDILCDHKLCYSELKGVPLYVDYGHLNDTGSRLIGELFLERYQNPFATNDE